MKEVQKRIMEGKRQGLHCTWKRKKHNNHSHLPNLT